ncbi:MAG: hypothetical protein KAG53_01165 [Endozoicomonadaceae bacterium]|nr:hypothetical protein [Endozoicomonadaceae bacterium]
MNHSVLDNKWLNLLIVHQANVTLVILALGILTTVTLQSLEMVSITADAQEKSISLSNDKITEKTISLADFSFLFGEAKNTDTGTKDIPKTSLNLTLRGVLAGDDSKDSSAIIQDNNNQEHFYRTGEILPGGAMLNEVYPQHVVIRHQGVLQKLTFPTLLSNKKTDSANYPPIPYEPQALSSLDDASQANTKAIDDKMEQLRQHLQPAQEN